MVTTTLPESETPFNTLRDNRPPSESSLISRRPDEGTGHTSQEGTIGIVMGLSGIISIEIFAHESATEELLRERLMAAQPILERLHATMNSLDHEPVGARN